MGAPTKEGLNYFPLDIDLFEDHKILYAQELIDPTGQDPLKRLLIPYVAIRLLREIYKNGYFMEWNNSQCLTMSSKIGYGITMGLLDNFSSILLKSGFFSDELYNKYNILTSHGIQKRWNYIVKSSHRKKVFIKEEYRLLTFENELSIDKTVKSTEETQKSSEETPQFGQETPQINISFSLEDNKGIENTGKSNNSKLNNINKVNKNKRTQKSTEETQKSTEETQKSTEETQKSTEETQKSTEETQKSTEETQKSTEETFAFINEDKKINFTELDLQILHNLGEDFKEAWLEWINYIFHEHRKELKSQQAKANAIQELLRLAEYNEFTAAKIIKQSISNAWKGFFPLQDKTQNSNGKNGQSNSSNGNIKGHQPFDMRSAFNKLDILPD